MRFSEVLLISVCFTYLHGNEPHILPDLESPYYYRLIHNRRIRNHYPNHIVLLQFCSLTTTLILQNIITHTQEYSCGGVNWNFILQLDQAFSWDRGYFTNLCHNKAKFLGLIPKAATKIEKIAHKTCSTGRNSDKNAGPQNPVYWT